MSSNTVIQIKEEEDVIDLDDYEKIAVEIIYDWDAEVRHQFCKYSIPDDEATLIFLIKDYKTLLEKRKNTFRDFDTFRLKLLCHVVFLYRYFKELPNCETTNYLEHMSEILLIYCNIEMKSIRLKEDILIRTWDFEECKKSACKRMIHALRIYLLDSDEHILHVLIKMENYTESMACNQIFLKLFKHFAVDTYPVSLGTESFCRHYIIFNKWKQMEKKENWPKLDKLFYKLFHRPPDYIEKHDKLKKILRPQFSDNHEILKRIRNIDITEQYFNYIKKLKQRENDNIQYNIDLINDDDEEEENNDNNNNNDNSNVEIIPTTSSNTCNETNIIDEVMEEEIQIKQELPMEKEIDKNIELLNKSTLNNSSPVEPPTQSETKSISILNKKSNEEEIEIMDSSNKVSVKEQENDNEFTKLLNDELMLTMIESNKAFSIDLTETENDETINNFVNSMDKITSSNDKNIEITTTMSIIDNYSNENEKLGKIMNPIINQEQSIDVVVEESESLKDENLNTEIDTEIINDNSNRIIEETNTNIINNDNNLNGNNLRRQEIDDNDKENNCDSNVKLDLNESVNETDLINYSIKENQLNNIIDNNQNAKNDNKVNIDNNSIKGNVNLLLDDINEFTNTVVIPSSSSSTVSNVKILEQKLVGREEDKRLPSLEVKEETISNKKLKAEEIEINSSVINSELIINEEVIIDNNVIDDDDDDDDDEFNSDLEIIDTNNEIPVVTKEAIVTTSVMVTPIVTTTTTTTRVESSLKPMNGLLNHLENNNKPIKSILKKSPTTTNKNSVKFGNNIIHKIRRNYYEDEDNDDSNINVDDNSNDNDYNIMKNHDLTTNSIVINENDMATVDEFNKFQLALHKRDLKSILRNNNQSINNQVITAPVIPETITATNNAEYDTLKPHDLELVNGHENDQLINENNLTNNQLLQQNNNNNHLNYEKFSNNNLLTTSGTSSSIINNSIVNNLSSTTNYRNNIIINDNLSSPSSSSSLSSSPPSSSTCDLLNYDERYSPIEKSPEHEPFDSKDRQILRNLVRNKQINGINHTLTTNDDFFNNYNIINNSTNNNNNKHTNGLKKRHDLRKRNNNSHNNSLRTNQIIDRNNESIKLDKCLKVSIKRNQLLEDVMRKFENERNKNCLIRLDVHKDKNETIVKEIASTSSSSNTGYPTCTFICSNSNSGESLIKGSPQSRKKPEKRKNAPQNSTANQSPKRPRGRPPKKR